MKRKNSGRLSAFSLARLLLGVALSLCGVALAFTVLRNSATRHEVADNDRDRAEEPARDMPIPGEDGDEVSGLNSLEQFWNDRLTYPTGKFDPAWVRAAATQDDNMPVGLPDGVVPASNKLRRLENGQTMGLSTAGFTALGPAPEHMTGCNGCYDYGLTEGRINDIVIDPTTTTNGSIVAYAASVGGGVWKTTNCCSSSTTWSVTTDGPLISTISIDTLAIDPNNHNTIYAGTGDLNFGSFSMGSQGILKSTDAGASWTVLGADVFGPAYNALGGGLSGNYPQYQAVGKVRVDPNNSNNVMAGTKSGVYLSNNGGATWTQCPTNSFTTQRQDITGLELTNMGNGQTRVIAAVGTRGFATYVQPDLGLQGANGIYIGTLPEYGCPSFTASSRNDNGFVFGTPGTGSPYANGAPMNAASGQPYVSSTSGNQLSRIDIAVAPSNPNTIYAQVGAISGNNDSGCGNANGCQLGAWSSTDGGNSWTFMTGSHGGSLAACTGNPGGGDYNQNWYDQGIAVDPNNPDRLFVSTFEKWLVSRTGTSWYDVTCGYNGNSVANHVVHVDQHAQVFVPGSSDIFLAGNDGGVHGTTNASAATTGGTRPTWFNMDGGLNTIEFYAGDISANFANDSSPVAVGGAQDNGPSSVMFSGSPTGPAQWQMGLGGDGFSGQVDPMTAGQTQASGSITVSAAGTVGQQFQIGSQVFTWAATRTTTGTVAIGTSASTAATAMRTAINTDLAGQVTAGGSGSTVTVTAVAPGSSGNSITFTNINSSNLTFNGSGTLGGNTQGGLLALRLFEGNNSGGFSRCVGLCTQPGATWASVRGGWASDQQSFVLPVNLFHGGIAGGDDCAAGGPTTGCGHLLAGTTRVWETITGANSSVTWYQSTPSTCNGTNACLTKGTLGNRSYINQIKYSPKWQSVAIVGTNDANVQIGFNLGTGVANQGNWVDVTGGNSVLPNRPIAGVALSPNSPSADVETGYAAVAGFNGNTPSTPGHVFQVSCTANCTNFSWADKSGNLPDIPVESVIVNPNYPQQVFAGSDFGIYFTNDITQASPTWSRFEGLPHVMVWDMMIDRGATTLSVWTRSRGAWVYPLTSSSITAAAPSLLSAASRMTHGSNGTFDLPLALTGPGTIEPRRNNAGTFSVVFTFDSAVTNATASSTSGSSSVTFSGNSAIVNVSGVADKQTVTVSVNNVSGPNSAVTPSASVTMRTLQADTNQDNAVNSGDSMQIRNASGEVVTTENFKLDVNADGYINVGDVLIERNNSGNSVAPTRPSPVRLAPPITPGTGVTPTSVTSE